MVTNLDQSLIDKVIGDQSVKIYVGNMILEELVTTFGSVPEGEPAAYIGSSGMLEIGINKGDAAEMMSVKKGAQISLVLQKDE
ncbi:MAG: SAM hydroxide adenosyltransferase [Balneolaceae bacterium]|nr:SAM hydroxide adenosyltransferase [Balneolaceae bacterium]